MPHDKTKTISKGCVVPMSTCFMWYYHRKRVTLFCWLEPSEDGLLIAAGLWDDIKTLVDKVDNFSDLFFACLSNLEAK